MHSNLVHRVSLVFTIELTDEGNAEDKKYKSTDLQKQHVEGSQHRFEKNRRA
jgi:hypothetical protein